MFRFLIEKNGFPSCALLFLRKVCHGLAQKRNCSCATDVAVFRKAEYEIFVIEGKGCASADKNTCTPFFIIG